MPTKKIETLEEIIPNLIPTEPLKGKELKRYYVDCGEVRGGVVTPDLEATIQLSKERPLRLLFAGHTGCGKSTELFRLIEAVKDKFFIVYFAITDLLDINDADYTDVLLAIGRELYSQGTSSLKLRKELIKDLEDWFKEIYDETINTVGGTKLSLKIPIIEIGNLLKSTEYRTVTRKITDKKISELLQRLNLLITEIKIKAKQEVLTIIDNLDRLDPLRSEGIFINHGAQIASLLSKTIYTVPISLIYSVMARALDQNFDSMQVLPMIKVTNKDNSPCTNGRKKLEDIIRRRMNPTLFETKALDAVIYFCAGSIRDLFRLIIKASLPAMRKEKIIGIEEVRTAVREFRNIYVRQTPKEYYNKLIQVYKTKRIANDKAHQEMLYNLTILEYNGEEQFYDLHSLVKLILVEESLIKDDEILKEWKDFVV